MKRKLLTMIVALGLISAGGWSMMSSVHAAQHQSQTNYQHISKSEVDNDRETNDHQREAEDGSRSKIERHGFGNLANRGHADKAGATAGHQFEGEE
ncbi:hypothetical protein BMS3Abin08_00630 [bacterium BMS3Abin08]|nr:hypothetical protein BMS3Abin08_00630 [bacterium BMS3Abin08]